MDSTKVVISAEDHRIVTEFNDSVAEVKSMSNWMCILGPILVFPFLLWLQIGIFPALLVAVALVPVIQMTVRAIGFSGLDKHAADQAALRIRITSKEQLIERDERIIEAAER